MNDKDMLTRATAKTAAGLTSQDWQRIRHAVRMFSNNTDFQQTIEKVEQICGPDRGEDR